MFPALLRGRGRGKIPNVIKVYINRIALSTLCIDTFSY